MLRVNLTLVPALLCLRVTALYAGYTRTIKIVWALFFLSYTIGGIFALISTATFFSEFVPPTLLKWDNTAIDSDDQIVINLSCLSTRLFGFLYVWHISGTDRLRGLSRRLDRHQSVSRRHNIT